MDRPCESRHQKSGSVRLWHPFRRVVDSQYVVVSNFDPGDHSPLQFHKLTSRLLYCDCMRQKRRFRCLLREELLSLECEQISIHVYAPHINKHFSRVLVLCFNFDTKASGRLYQFHIFWNLFPEVKSSRRPNERECKRQRAKVIEGKKSTPSSRIPTVRCTSRALPGSWGQKSIVANINGR